MGPPTSNRAEVLQGAARAAERLARNPRVKLVYLFGSAASKEGREPRDLDLAVWTDPPLSLEELMRCRADVVMDSTIPIDLVSLNDASIVLAHEIVEGGRCLYARDGDVETDVVTRARMRFWDFKPYRDDQWRLTRERLEERLVGS